MRTQMRYFGLGTVPIGIGAVAEGWGIREDYYRDNTHLSVVDFRAMSEECRLNCFDCFARQAKTLSLNQISSIIDQIAKIGAIGINYLGEGEPTIDEYFFSIVNRTIGRGIQAIVFTDAIGLIERTMAKIIFSTGITVFPKCDSLFNAEYQNWKVGDTKGLYFNQRNRALRMLMEVGFNQVSLDGTTRLGLDMVITKQNVDEIPRTLRWCREHNIFIIFSRWLPTGNCARPGFDNSLAVTKEEMAEMGKIVQQIDLEEFGFNHPIYSNFLTFPCVERLQILGNGDITPCPGNETVIGNVLETPLREIHEHLLEQFPCFNPETYDGNCWCRK